MPTGRRINVCVTVPAGASSATFPVTTADAGFTATVTITGTYAGISQGATLVVGPAATSVTPTSVTVTPSSVKGGSTSTGQVTLSGPAPAGGLVVSLSSSNPTVADVPSNVIVPAGATQATFTVKTARVKRSTSVIIFASANGVTQSATLLVK